MNAEYLKLVKYVNAVADLAECVLKDIKSKDQRITNETVLALSRLTAASSSVQKMLDQVELTNVKLN